MVACNALGEIWEERGALDEARRFWERALRCRREIDAVNVGTIHGSMPQNLLALARVTAKQGQLSTASKLLREALPIAHEIRDEATARQIAELLAQTSRVEPTASATLRPEGGVWHIAFNGTSVHVPDMKGLWHLRELVSRPARRPCSPSRSSPHRAKSRFRSATPDPCSIARRSGSTENVLLSWTRSSTKPKPGMTSKGTRSAAPSARRSSRSSRGRRASAASRGGPARPRREARLNVTRTIRHAITYLSTALPELAAHLDESVATGVSCCYEPRTNIAWTT